MSVVEDLPMTTKETQYEIGELCQLINGRAFKPVEWKTSGLPIIRIQNLNDSTKEFNYFDGEYDERHEVNDGELLFSWSGTPGTSFGAFFWNRGKAVLNQHIFRVLVDRARVDKGYFRYAMNNRLNRIIDQAHGGVGLKHITKGRLEAVKVPLPKLSEQKRIAGILDKADAIRRKRQQAIGLTEQFLRSTFLDMFGDPVTNPKGWPVEMLSDLTTKITDGTHKTPKYVSEGVRFISAKNVFDGGIDWSDIKFVTKAEHDELFKRCNAEPNDVLLTKSGSIGRAAVVDVDFPFCLFESLALLKIQRDLLIPRFLAEILNSDAFQRIYQKGLKGIAVKHLHLVDIRGLQIITPPMRMQEAFLTMAEKLRDKQQRYFFADDQSNNLFNSLVQRAFRGEL